jgi:hypothetical protein
MKRSRFIHFGFAGWKCRNRSQRTCTTGAKAIGVPGWPEFAFWTASMARVRIVLMQGRSRLGSFVIKPPSNCVEAATFWDLQTPLVHTMEHVNRLFQGNFKSQLSQFPKAESPRSEILHAGFEPRACFVSLGLANSLRHNAFPHIGRCTASSSRAAKGQAK